jgi:hypothetical protein
LADSKKIGYGGESWKLEATPRGSEASERSRHSRDLGVRSWTSWVLALVRLSIRSWSGRRPMLITLLDAPGISSSSVETRLDYFESHHLGKGNGR